MKAVNYGIDLGTTNSLIAKYENGNVTVFKNPIGHKETLASVVAYRKDKILIGDKAREYIAKDPINVFSGFKRKMGTDEKFYIVNRDENVSPIQLSSLLLQELKSFIHSGETPEAAVVTIPASFDSMQSNATQKAGQEAGFKTVFLLQEPIAASLAYFNHSSKDDNSGYWLVYDLGGGTFDAALIEIKEGEMKVVDHEGNNFLGGVDFDFSIVEKLIVPVIAEKLKLDNFLEKLTAANSPYEKLYYILLHKAEEAKKELSSMEETDIEFSIEIDDVEEEMVITITRKQFNEIISSKIFNTIQMLRQILDRSQLSISDIQQLILVGGSTYIPYVREKLSSELGIHVNTDVDPTTAVAEGAAFYAANKNYTPSEKDQLDEISTMTVDDLLGDALSVNTSGITFQLSYTKTTKEDEEIILVKIEGDYPGFGYRIIRKDGGFDSGIKPMKTKFTEFLPLLKNLTNQFELRVYDQAQHEVKSLLQLFAITQGQYNIQGQPIPKDICVEVDDFENKTTKLETVFEKNSILPQKKTLYREISRTIQKGSGEKLVINILEGDRFARPISNLPIGIIEISGKELTSDLLKGSDIEIKLMMDESRQIHCSVYLVMTEQEFKNVFSISEKHISLSRLKEQYFELENEMRKALKFFNYNGDKVLAIQAQNLLNGLEELKSDIGRLKEGDKGDKKYIIAETVYKTAGEFDKIGGEDHLSSLRDAYLETKEFVETQLPLADFEKDSLLQRFKTLTANEEHLLKTRNASVLVNASKRMDELGWEILYNTISYLIGRYATIKTMSENSFTNYSGAKKIFKLADQALDKEEYHGFRQNVYNLTHLLIYDKSFDKGSENFKGTGLG